MNFNFLKRSLYLALTALVAFSAMSCKDEVDESDLYTFTGETITSYLEASENYTSFAYICGRVRLSRKSDSYVSQLLSARGNYTVFAPSNRAIQKYLDSIYVTHDYDLTQIPDSTAEYIVRNAIIDHGNDEAYLSTDFQVGALDRTNMNDRYITISYGTDSVLGRATTIINEASRVVLPDVEVSNGVVHGVDEVLQLSNAYLPALIDRTPNLKIFSYLLKQTGWDDKMSLYRDEDYEQNHAEELPILDQSKRGKAPEHRYYGFTAFVEPDSIFVEKWGVPEPQVENGILLNGAEIFAVIKQKCAEAYPDAKDADVKSEENAVNQFVSYHLLPERLTLEKLVVHHTEMGYAYKNPEQLSIDCFEYYETMCTSHRRLVKLTHGKQTDGRRINRHCKQRTNVAEGEFFEEYDIDRPGILIEESNRNYLSNALNGFYYTIDDILIYDDDVPNKVLNERLRWDACSLLPEMMTNGYRLYNPHREIPFPAGYFSTLSYSEGTRLVYLPYYNNTAANYQGDEINLRGQYDVILRLPPVPYKGTYEFRICAPHFPSFGMGQLYIGKNPNNLQPIGLPLDLRQEQTGEVFCWENEVGSDDKIDWDKAYENDKVMRNHGFMRPPYHDGQANGGNVVTSSMRCPSGYASWYQSYLRFRRIVYQGTFDPDEVWYIRVKSVLENSDACFLLDYLEFAPKWVYAGAESEDVW